VNLLVLRRADDSAFVVYAGSPSWTAGRGTLIASDGLLPATAFDLSGFARLLGWDVCCIAIIATRAIIVLISANCAEALLQCTTIVASELLATIDIPILRAP
jgi:hypothetical protein